MTDPAKYLADLLASETPAPETIEWLRSGFQRHLAGESFASSFGHDIRDSYQRQQWRHHLGKAISMLAVPGVSRLSIAKALSAEFSRQQRTLRKPVGEFERHIRAAMDSCPYAATTAESLWHEVSRYSKNKPTTN